MTRLLPLFLLTVCISRTHAELCTTTNATPWESLDSSSGDGSGSGSESGSAYDPNYNDYLTSIWDSVNGASDAAGDLIVDSIKRVKKRDTLECTDAEACISISTLLLCVNPETSDYHTDTETGNLITGDYTLNDGTQGNFRDGSTPTLTSAVVTPSSSARAVPTSVLEQDNTPSTASSMASSKVGSSGPSATAVAAEPTPTGGANGVRGFLKGLGMGGFAVSVLGMLFL